MAVAQRIVQRGPKIRRNRVALAFTAALSGLVGAALFVGRTIGAALTVQGVSPASLG